LDEEEEEVQLFHILFPIVPGKQRFQEKIHSLCPHHMPHVGTNQSTWWSAFLEGGRQWGPPLTMSDVPPLVYLWSCENLQHCWKHFLASKITKMSELVGNLFLFFVVPSQPSGAFFFSIFVMYPHHTGGGDHPSIHQEEELAKLGYRTDRKVDKI
jgi:hypothetical protein